MTAPLSQNIADLRRDYRLAELDEASAGDRPLALFGRWFEAALSAQVPEPNAMTLATIGLDGRPAARIVLLKGLDEHGLCFFTNYDSRKGRELAAHPDCALVFLWDELERQVRIEGRAEKVTARESDDYYASRPLGSRLGAWASPQSEVIESRDWLQAREAEFRQRLGEAPPRPDNWGGYRVVPEVIEFWQGRSSRLHDRLRFSRQAGGDTWRIERLAP